MDITPYIQLMIDKEAESLLLSTGRLPQLNIQGKRREVGSVITPRDVIQEIIDSTTSEQQKEQFVVLPSLRYSAKMEEYSLHFYAHEKNNELLLTIRLDLSKPITKKKASPTDFDIYHHLKEVIKLEGSDLFISAGAVVTANVEGKAIELGSFVLSLPIIQSLAENLMSKAQFDKLKETKELDFAISMPDNSGRFRVNAFYQRGSISLVMRLIPAIIPRPEDLGLPSILLEMMMEKQGILLMVGSTGSGKSTSLAAMLNHRNINATGHILTIEDPIEFSHPNIKSIINQREVGVDTFSYKQALRSSFREAPDVILIGEIRDRETMEAALELANTGHLCISTLHANNANQAMDRIINMFPQIHHKQLFMDLSTNLRGVISQRLISDLDGKRCAAIEVMINTPHIANLILKGDLSEIKGAMTNSTAKGMKTFDDALLELYKAERISLEEALKNADSRNNLETKINFG